MTSAAAPFSQADWIVLIGYFASITFFGLWVSRKVRQSRSYFLGDQKLPWWIMVGQAFGTGTNAENPVAQTGASYHSGFSTIWYQWKNMLITPFYWLMAPWYRRSGRTTISGMINDRYGSGMALVYTIFAILFFVFNQGAMLKGAAKIISTATGGGVISPNTVVFVMTVAFIAYSYAGGLIASAYTDFIQGILIIVLSFLLIPAGLTAIGGLDGMRTSLPPDFFLLYSDDSGLGLFAILMLAVNGIVGITAMPHMISMNATGSSERAGRVGQTYGSIIKRICTVGWAFTGLIVAVLVIKNGDTLKDPENAFGYAALHLLKPGFVGLLVACVLAANMSTCSNFMVNTGALFTNDIYKTYVNPKADDRRLLMVGRISGLGLTLSGVAFALFVDQVLQAFLFTETIAALMGIMFMGGILWKRANRYGAMASTAVSFITYYGVNWYSVGELRLVYKWLPGPFAWAMGAGIVAFVGVSLLTRTEDRALTDSFFLKLSRSSDGGSSGGSEGQPSAASFGQDLLLVDGGSWFTRHRWLGFRSRYKEDLIGFALASLTVVAMIAFAWLLMRYVAP